MGFGMAHWGSTDNTFVPHKMFEHVTHAMKYTHLGMCSNAIFNIKLTKILHFLI